MAQPGTTVKEVEQEVIFLAATDKRMMLQKLLERYTGSVLVFSRTKWGAKKLAADVRAMGYAATEIHADRSLAQRRAAMAGFSNGAYRVLVATDIAARGIDVKNIELVINFDLPDNPDDYVHRIGRTARAGKKGRAISFATPDQRRDVQEIERLIRTQLPVGKDSQVLPQPSRGTYSSQRRTSRFRGRPQNHQRNTRRARW